MKYWILVLRLTEWLATFRWLMKEEMIILSRNQNRFFMAFAPPPKGFSELIVAARRAWLWVCLCLQVASGDVREVP
jgi:hypothetical protein